MVAGRDLDAAADAAAGDDDITDAGTTQEAGGGANRLVDEQARLCECTTFAL